MFRRLIARWLPAKVETPRPSRREVLLSLFDATGRGLEIGASFNPLLPKKDGYNVEVLDHLSAEELVKKYAGASSVDPTRIEPVDYVSHGASLFDAIGEEARFDYIVASHVIEHTVDLLGFLNDCERLLRPRGVVVLAVPDKRFSFDVLRPLTSTGDVLQRHLDKQPRHSLGALFDEVAYNSLRGGALAWAPTSQAPLAFASELQTAKSIFEQAQHDGLFRDIHAWQFTPSSFRLLVNDLYEIGYLGLREQAFRDDLGSEFAITLSRQGEGPKVSRLSLAERALVENAWIKASSN